MAPHSRKASLKRVATGEDTNHLTLGIKEVRFVSPDYKTKHHIGRRGTHVLTYNETLLHYRVMANACLEESAVKHKISGKKPSNKIALKDKTKKSAKKVISNDSLIAYAAKSSSVNSFNKESLIKRSGKKCQVKDSRKVSKQNSCIKRSTANNPVKKSIAKEMLAQGTTTVCSAVKNYAKPLSKKHSINYTLKKKTVKTAWKFSSKHIKKKLSKTSDLPTIEENLLELNQCKKLSVCLIRLKREASLNAAAKVKLIYNENQQNSPERRKPRDSESGNLHKTKDPPVLKNGQFFKTSKSHSSDSKCSLSQSKDGVCTNKKKNFDLLPFRTVKPFMRTVSETLKKETCKEKSCLIENKTKDIASMQNKFNHRIQNPFIPCNSLGNQTMQNKEKRKNNNSNKGFSKKSKRFIGYKCSEECLACRFHTNDYLVGFVDQTKQNCMNQPKCQFIESCINTKDDSAPKERNPSCFLHLTNNKRIIFSPQKNILSKYAKSYDKNEDMELVYGSPKKESESCFPDYRNLNGCIRDNMNATNNDSSSVGTVQTSCSNNCQHIKYAVRDHSLHFDNGSTTVGLGLPSNFYGSTGPHLCKSDKEYCCTATRHDFCQTKCQKHCAEESSAGKLSKRMASLNAQAIMDACQESQYSKRELLQNSQRSARTHYIFSPKRQSCRWVDGLGGMYLAKDLQNSSSNDLKQKIVSCSTTNPNSSRNMSKNCSITSNNNHSPDMQLQTKNHERIKQKPDNLFEGAPQFSKFNNAISTSRGRKEMVSCCSFPYMHGENVSPTKCQTFTLNGVGSISSQPYQPYRSHFSLHCNHASIPHYSCYSNDSCYSRSSTMVQSKPFMITSPIPIHVPHAEVKVLIHSSHPSQPFIPTTADSPKQHKNKRGNQTVQNKKKLDTRQKNDSTKTVNIRSKPKLGKRNCDLKEGPLKKVEKQYLPSKRKKPNSSNSGWSWEGEPEMKPVMDLNIDAPPVERKCYPAIKHTDGECIRVRDCVLLRSGPRKNDLPFTAKVVAFWENSTDGEMMMSLLWYYRPEHTESGRQPHNIDCEIFASKHRDINNVACIEEKCYVLTFNEYCRYKAEIRRSESNLPARQKVVPASESYHRQNRLPPVDADSETVFLCRKVYHFRQKRILKS